MGRHSAADEPEEGTGAVATDLAEPAGSHGRHVAPEPAAASAGDPQPEVAAEAPADQPARRERGTQADLRLLREHPALRAQCIAAAIVPFVVYTVVLFALARVHIYVLWLWAPIIAAGFLVGAVLDAAHRRLDAKPPADAAGGP